MKIREGLKFEPTPEESAKQRAAESAQFLAVAKSCARQGVGVLTEERK